MLCGWGGVVGCCNLGVVGCCNLGIVGRVFILVCFVFLFRLVVYPYILGYLDVGVFISWGESTVWPLGRGPSWSII